MAMEYTVIQPVRQRFGKEIPAENYREVLLELDAPWVGEAKDFSFSCPNVDPSQMAVLQFNSLGVQWRQGITADAPYELIPGGNILRINSVGIPGGISLGASEVHDGKQYPLWTTHSLLVPVNVLLADNVLHIASVRWWIGHDTTLDDFIIDNVVLFYKTRRTGGTAGPGEEAERFVP